MEGTNFFELILELPNFKVDKVETSSTEYNIYGSFTLKEGVCPSCQNTTALINQTRILKYRDLKISGRTVCLHVSIPQFSCSECGRYFLSHPDWITPGKSYTKRQAKWIFEMCRKQSFLEVAALTNMTEKTVSRVFFQQSEEHINLPKRYAQVRQLGIDEVSHQKGKQGYICVLTDLERGTQLDILPNRKKETLVEHFKSLGSEFCEQIKLVSCDIWKAYIYAAEECFPNCEVVLDRFHLVKALNDVLDYQRKSLRREFKGEECFKQLKWILFKRYDKCTEANRELLEEAFSKSVILEELHTLRRSFNALFDLTTTAEDLSKELHSWVQHAKLLDFERLNKFTATLQRWKSRIVTFAPHRISNAVTEGLNNNLRLIKRIGFGVPNFNNLRLRVLAITR
jgi:transposase